MDDWIGWIGWREGGSHHHLAPCNTTTTVVIDICKNVNVQQASVCVSPYPPATTSSAYIHMHSNIL